MWMYHALEIEPLDVFIIPPLNTTFGCGGESIGGDSGMEGEMALAWPLVSVR